jgi:uncharacterized protein (UPF0332 family)
VSERDEAIDIRLTKARECLDGAESEYVARRFYNVANRCYYAAFQAAIAALMHADIRPQTRDGSWGHDFVQAQSWGVLVPRRKAYPQAAAEPLVPLMKLRHLSDYSLQPTTEIQAARVLRQARLFLATIELSIGGTR